ncbi:hypothetical protein HNQ35_000198 [Cerasibacillus quisquiliarum]|nr:hypothetical protein [Cerasibacillus quisquiliarum]
MQGIQQMIFSDPLKLNAVRYGDQTAVSFQGKSLTYKE